MRTMPLVALMTLFVAGCSSSPVTPPSASVPAPSTGSPAGPSIVPSTAPASAPAIALPSEDWSDPASDPALRTGHDAACRATGAVPADRWAGLVRVVEQQRSGWPYHLYWDGGTLHVACFAPPYDLAAVEVSIVDWADRDPAGRRSGVADFEGRTFLPQDERWMGWGTVDPLAVRLDVRPSDGPATAATVANGYFVAQWPVGSDRRAPRLEAIDACGVALATTSSSPTPCPATP